MRVSSVSSEPSLDLYKKEKSQGDSTSSFMVSAAIDEILEFLFWAHVRLEQQRKF